MIWEAILFETCPDEAAIRGALAAVFGVSSLSVGVVRSTEASTGSASVRVEMIPVRGDFACMVTVAIDDALIGVDPLSGVVRVCTLLGTSAFASDGSDDSCSGLLIDATGRTQHAELDPDAEERGEYRFWRGRP